MIYIYLKFKRVIIVVVVIVTLLWISGIIPKAIGEGVAKKYVSDIHSDADLTFEKLEFSSAHSDYFAVFFYPNGERILFQLIGGRFFPFAVWYDPLRPVG